MVTWSLKHSSTNLNAEAGSDELSNWLQKKNEGSNTNDYSKADMEIRARTQKPKGDQAGNNPLRPKETSEWRLKPRGKDLAGNESLEILGRKWITEATARGSEKGEGLEWM